MRTSNVPTIGHRWHKLGLALSAVALLSTCSPLPSLIDQIKTLGELRVVTRTGPLSYYVGSDDTPDGPEYALAQRFADELGVKLKIMPVKSYAEMYAALNTGRAHLAAAGLKIPVRPIEGIEFGPVYQRVREHLIYRRGEPRPTSLADIGNGDLEIAAGSSHAKALIAARDSLPDLVWVEDPTANSQALLEDVASGTVDYTIADSTEFAFAHDAHPDLRIAFDFPGSQSLAWAASDRYPEFVRDMDTYFASLQRSGYLASTLSRYYDRSEGAEFAEAPVFMRHFQDRLPLYKRWFEEAAEQSSQDWRLLAAIGYEESKWNPRAASPSGALGLMQLTLQSANAVKVANPADPRQSIFGGARYFRQIYEKIPSHVPEPDRTWFALAAYNIGYGHLEDARILTQRAGKDPDSWDDVREFLPLLADEYWYTQTSNGYARGSEPVRYVDAIRTYVDLLEWVDAGVTHGPSGVSLN